MWSEKDWKEFIQGESELEADLIMAEVNADPEMANVVAPEEMDKALKIVQSAQI